MRSRKSVGSASGRLAAGLPVYDARTSGAEGLHGVGFGIREGAAPTSAFPLPRFQVRPVSRCDNALAARQPKYQRYIQLASAYLLQTNQASNQLSGLGVEYGGLHRRTHASRQTPNHNCQPPFTYYFTSLAQSMAETAMQLEAQA